MPDVANANVDYNINLNVKHMIHHQLLMFDVIALVFQNKSSLPCIGQEISMNRHYCVNLQSFRLNIMCITSGSRTAKLLKRIVT